MPTTQRQEHSYSSSDIRTGDALLVKSNAGWLSQLISFLSGSSFVHTAIAVRIDRHLYVVECKFSTLHSYQLMPIDWWLARNADDQLFIGKMPAHGSQRGIRRQVRDTIMSSTESLRPYKIGWLVAIYFLQTWFGKSRPQFKHLFKGSRPLICSTLVQEAWERAGVIPKGAYMTPGDIVDLLGGETALIPVFDNKISHRPVRLKASNDASNSGQPLAHA